MKLIEVITTATREYLNEQQEVENNKLNEELIYNDVITVYHGTKPKSLNSIKRDGLIDKSGYNQGWYMVSTDFESALFHAHPDETDNNVYVIEFEIPNNKNDRWRGYPYLWKGQKMKDNSVWFALMQKIPNEFIKKIHKINYDDWIKQKEQGF
jgi:RNA:NAD 2'-phosphotransferase (TPT1/KptA family)